MILDDPREHHYQFVHRALPQIAEDSPRYMWNVLRTELRDQMLLRIWGWVAEKLPEEQRLSSEGLMADFVSVGNYSIGLIALPVPQMITEAFFAAFVFGPFQNPLEDPGMDIPFRYFTLELGTDMTFTQERTVVGEWSHGSHYNYGDGPLPEPNAFLVWICSRFFADSPEE